MGNTLKHIVAAVLVMTALPAAAHAQDSGANDPEPDSPPGAIYEIPLDTARDDAAPRSGGGSGADPAAGGSDSSLRSENGLGSSSQVPGAPADGVSPDDTESQSTDQAGGAADRGDDSRSRRGSGSGGGSSGSDQDAAERLIAPSSAAQQAEPSSIRAYLLLVLGVLVAVGIAVAARRAWR